MQKIEIQNLISFIEEGTDAEGSARIKCTFDITNNTQYLWDHIEYDALFFNIRDDFLSHIDGTIDCNLMPGETHSEDLSHGINISYKLEALITGEPVKCILYAKAFHDFKIDLGTYNLPPLPDTHIKIVENQSFEGIEFLNGVMHTDSPDRRKRVRCRIELGVHNHTAQNLRIKLSGEERSNTGIEITGYNRNYDAKWQGIINGQIDATTSQLKDARVSLHAWVLAVVGSTEPY
jgi:hypothetical protein